MRPHFIDKVAHFEINPLLKAFIIAEMWLWSAFNLINPIFAIYITRVPGGNVELAAGAVSAYLLVRVVVELTIGKILSKASRSIKLLTTILGMIIISASYVSLAYADSIDEVYIFYSLLAFGIGFATPAKNSLFSMSLDKDKESFEWGLMDASAFLSMAIAAVIGGYIAQNYGFKALFFFASVVNGIGIIPYLLYWKNHRE